MSKKDSGRYDYYVNNNEGGGIISVLICRELKSHSDLKNSSVILTKSERITKFFSVYI